MTRGSPLLSLACTLLVSTSAFGQAPPMDAQSAEPRTPPVEGSTLPNQEIPKPSIWGPALGKPMSGKARWYGAPTMVPLVIVDLFALTAIVAGNENLLYASLIPLIPTHILTGPIVHWAHGHAGRGFLSLGLNIGLPLVGLLPGGFIGLAADSMPAVSVGPVLGALVAGTLDIAVLSHDRVKVPLDQPKGAQALFPSNISVVPMLDARQRGLSIVGQF